MTAVETTVENPLITITEPVHCFVCDVAVTTGRHYTLATCRTQTTNIRLIEKLGQMVGDKYMVVICEDDIICRGCATLLNTLDRLEKEMGSVRNVVLKFLEKKYSLEDGELVNNKTTGIGLPPQITPRNMSPKSVMSENYMFQKRKAALSNLENEENILENNYKSKKADSKNEMWMQCDKCKYTTHYNAFMIHHLRQHTKRKKVSACDFCGEKLTGGNCVQQCSKKERSSASGEKQQAVSTATSKTVGKVNGRQGPPDTEAETVEMIAAEINEFSGVGTSEKAEDIKTVNVLSGETLEENPSEHLAATFIRRNEEIIIPISEVQHQLAAGNIEMQMTDQEGSTPTTICVMEMAEGNVSQEPTLLTVQKVEGNGEEAVYVQVVEVGKDGEGSSIPKVLTVSDDGTVEMVEVMWDDVVASQVGTGETMEF